MCLNPSLIACTTPSLLTDPVITERIVIERVTVDSSLTEPCFVSPLPAERLMWKDIFSLISIKHFEQVACNVRLESIRTNYGQ